MSEEFYMFDNDAPEMQAAYKRARETFRYFWREKFWEYRRIVPGLTVACVKLPFSDGDLAKRDSEVEHMWVDEIDFDGRNIHGELINDPNWLKTVKKGDSVKVPVGAISDWMYAHGETVYGGFSVNAMRSKMGKQERAQHDGAWGLNFCDPNGERIIPSKTNSKAKGSLFGKFFGSKITPSSTNDLTGDHPMAANMVEKYEEQLSTEPEILQESDDMGWTQLHHHALAGNLGVVKLILKLGGNPSALTPEGVDAASLARVLNWEEVAMAIDNAES